MRYQIYEAKSVKYDAQQRVGMTEHVWGPSRKLQEASNEIAVSAGYQGL